MSHTPAINEAIQAVEAARTKAEQDPSRPVCHFRPPAQWMNDPNGPLFFDDHYHVFYQHNPYGDKWGHMHWGHARSSDLVNWEHLPIALAPALDDGEEHCYSGCATVNGDGDPMIFYTSVPPKNESGEPQRPFEQWAAVSKDGMQTWARIPENPLVTITPDGGPKMDDSTRDPFIFQEDGRTFMVLGTVVEGKPAVPIFEADDASLTSWSYRGDIFATPPENMKFPECPNFFRLEYKWVLLTSPYGPVRAMVGDFDLDTLKFTPETDVLLDSTPDFYATNILFDPKSRHVMLAWIRGFEGGKGWNGCLALPRVLSLDLEGGLIQDFVPELQMLRRKSVVKAAAKVEESLVINEVKADCLELVVDLDQGDATTFGLTLGSTRISCDSKTITVAGKELDARLDDGTLRLHLILDKSVLEVLVDHRGSATVVVPYDEADDQVTFFAEGGAARILFLEGWELAPVW